jgi:hypothetical protein
VPDLNHKFKAIQSHVGVPIVFLAATVSAKATGEEAQMRKPQQGMWKYLLKSIYEVGNPLLYFALLLFPCPLASFQPKRLTTKMWI